MSNNLKQNKESNMSPTEAFFQQRLPTFYPVLNAGFVFPIFFILSTIFIPLGVGIYYYAEGIFELSIEYSDCTSLNVDHRNLSCEAVLNGTLFNKNNNSAFDFDHSATTTTVCNCRKTFNLEKPINGTVYIYYGLTNFYQNHLKYFKNRDENQFKGGIVRLDEHNQEVANEPSASCKPERYRIDHLKRPILPCGVQANSMFFDVIKLSHMYEERDNIVPLNRTGIAWKSDKKKFNNPDKMENPKDSLWTYFGKPPSWKKYLWELDTNKHNNGLENEDFIIWMKTSAFPNFRKLHRIVRSQGIYTEGLPAGEYSILIEYNMAVSKFNGTKSVILTNSREVAGKNYFLSASCFITGIILFVLFIIFLVIHLLTRNRHIDFKKID